MKVNIKNLQIIEFIVGDSRYCDLKSKLDIKDRIEFLELARIHLLKFDESRHNEQLNIFINDTLNALGL